MKELDTIEISSGGKTVNTTPEKLEQASNELSSLDNIFKEVKGQIDNMLVGHQLSIYKAYKSNANELKINLSINLKGDSQMVNVKSTLSFVAEKITDEIEAQIKINQSKLTGL